MKWNQKSSAALFGAFLGCSMGFVGTVQATPLALGTQPLFLTNQADPNIFFEMDDSGSMDWEIVINRSVMPAGFATIEGVFGSSSSNAEPYLYNNSDNVYQGSHWDEVATDWRARCSCFNLMAYDPSVTYDPWPGMPNAVFTAARSNPQAGPLLDNSSGGYGVTRDLTGDTYYAWTDTNTDGKVDAGEQGAATVVTAASPEAQNYANWYQYHRRRSFVAKSAVGTVVDQNPGFRYGLSLLNDWSGSGNKVFVEVPSALISNYSSHNSSMVDQLYKYAWEGQGTPLRQALKRTGQYFDDTLSGKTDPIISECQKNFAILFTDGHWNGSSPSVGDDDSDGHSNTLADVARQYYDTDLSPLANNVPPDSFDTNTRQHMVTFTVAFGINGLLADTDSDGWPNPVLAEGDNWGNPFSGDPQKVDDLWHAAFNSKGTFVAAQSPQDVADGINDALANIASRTSSAASVALNAGSIGANSRVYQAKFDTTKWSGQLLEYTVSTLGVVSATPNWDAGCKITGGTCPTTGSTETAQNWNTGRELIAFKPSNGNGIPFRWPANPASPTATELDVAQTSALDIDDATGLADGQAMLRWQYLRGDTTIAGFRSRDSVLGDVIHAAPVYVGAPAFNYPDSLETTPYSTFRNTYQNRKPIIWFGANDGIFHGVDASIGSLTSGKEVLGYVPGSVFNKLNALTSPGYNHDYYVDGVPTAGDVFLGGLWQTVIVSGLAGGGQGLFALNVTNPALLDEAHADDISLWEFSDSDDVDMGYSYGQPSIVKLHNGSWAAVFGNGYGNTHDDDDDGTSANDSTTGNSVIYIVDIATGGIIKKFDTGVGSSADPENLSRPNGMASPTVIDVDNNKIADYIFAGDLFGNVWKIDITDPSPSNWKFDYSASSPHTPLFVTSDGTKAQPITTAPEVTKHPQGGYLVFLGTGKYLEVGDDTHIGQQTQAFYGIWDKDGASLTAFTRDHLLQQSITKEIVEVFDTDQDGTRGSAGDETTEVRETTDYSINWHTASGLPSGSPITTHLGWYIDLYNTEAGNTNNYGERQVTDSTLVDGVIVFNTLVPSSNPCDFGGDSWIVALDSESGARYVESVFDLDKNGTFDLFDGIQAANATSGADTVVSMTKSTVGILPRLTFARGYGGDTTVAIGSGSSGGFMRPDMNRDPDTFGRQSWHQILE